MNFTRPEISDILIKINDGFYYISKDLNEGDVRFSIFDLFSCKSDDYKEKFIKYINREDKRILKEDVVSYDDYELLKTQFYTNFNRNIKIGKIFSNRNSFNLFYIMYKHSNSINKYGIKRYLFKEYIESDELLTFKFERLKEAIINFYTNEDNINKYILGNKDFIYSDYNKEELKVLYEMGLFVEDDDLESEIFNDLKGFELIDVIMNKNVSSKNEVIRGDIFANDVIYECFLHIYNNSKSFRRLRIRKESLYDFLEKDYIGVDSAINFIDILIDYMKNLDEIFSSPFYKLLDDLFLFNKVCENEYNEINNQSDKIYSDIELKFLGIFYDIDKIKGYKYFDSKEYMDSDYLKNNEENKNKGIGLSHSEYNNSFRT